MFLFGFRFLGGVRLNSCFLGDLGGFVYFFDLYFFGAGAVKFCPYKKGVVYSLP